MAETVKCSCGRDAILRTGDYVYGEDYTYVKLWVCENYPEHDSFVGCHKGTDKPLGPLADPDLRELRKRAYEELEVFWTSGQMNRKLAFELLIKLTGVKHISSTDKVGARRIIKKIQQYKQKGLGMFPDLDSGSMELQRALLGMQNVDSVLPEYRNLPRCGNCEHWSKAGDIHGVCGRITEMAHIGNTMQARVETPEGDFTILSSLTTGVDFSCRLHTPTGTKDNTGSTFGAINGSDTDDFTF